MSERRSCLRTTSTAENHSGARRTGLPQLELASTRSPKITSPYPPATPADDALDRILRHPSAISAVDPPEPPDTVNQSNHITWRNRLKGLWFAASSLLHGLRRPNPIFHRPQRPPMKLTHKSATNPTRRSTTDTHAEQVPKVLSPAPQFNFGQISWASNSRPDTSITNPNKSSRS